MPSLDEVAKGTFLKDEYYDMIWRVDYVLQYVSGRSECKLEYVAGESRYNHPGTKYITAEKLEEDYTIVEEYDPIVDVHE